MAEDVPASAAELRSRRRAATGRDRARTGSVSGSSMSLLPRSSVPASARSSSSQPGPRLPKQRRGRAGQPSGSKLARVRQIADRIPKAYKQPNGEQLTVSQASQLAVPTESGDMPVTSIFVRPDTSRGLAEESDIDAFNGAGAVAYGLCGLGGGAQCAIKRTGVRRAVHAAEPPGARAFPLHLQVRRRTSIR